MKKLKVGIADNQEIFRKGFVLLLESFNNIEVVIEEENGSNLLDRMSGIDPDIVIIDYFMPLMGGLETSKEIKKRFPLVKIIILSSNDGHEYVENAIKSGVNGFLSKEDGINEIELAIKEVMINHYYINDRISKVFINSLIKKKMIKPSSASGNIEFNQDEVKILDMISKEFTTQQISDALNKGTRTIEKYKSKMMDKVGAQNSFGLIMYAIKNKIIEV